MAAGRLRDVGVTLCEGPTPQAFRAVVGALFTAGIRPAEIGSLAHTVRWTRLVHASMNRRVLLDSTGLAAFLHDALGGGGFYAMQRRFAVVACELTTGEQALPLLHALIAAAEARRDWQQAASGSPVTPEVSRSVAASTIGCCRVRAAAGSSATAEAGGCPRRWCRGCRVSRAQAATPSWPGAARSCGSCRRVTCPGASARGYRPPPGCYPTVDSLRLRWIRQC
jgi:hypothetical protein